LETGDSIEVFLEDFEGVSKDQVIKVIEMSQTLPLFAATDGSEK
jgi:uncharacterized protein (DUF433 family)